MQAISQKKIPRPHKHFEVYNRSMIAEPHKHDWTVAAREGKQRSPSYRLNENGVSPQGGEFVSVLSPKMLAGEGWQTHAESFINKLSAMPDARKHKNTGKRTINTKLLNKIRALAE